VRPRRRKRGEDGGLAEARGHCEGELKIENWQSRFCESPAAARVSPE